MERKVDIRGILITLKNFDLSVSSIRDNQTRTRIFFTKLLMHHNTSLVLPGGKKLEGAKSYPVFLRNARKTLAKHERTIPSSIRLRLCLPSLFSSLHHPFLTSLFLENETIVPFLSDFYEKSSRVSFALY